MREQGSVLLLALCLEEGCDVCSDDVVLCPNCGNDWCLHMIQLHRTVHTSYTHG